MATVDTLARAAGGMGEPGRRPYFVEVEIDLAAAATGKGSALAAADTIGAITVDEDTLVLACGAEITEAPAGGTAATFDLGTDVDPDGMVAGATLTGASLGDYTQAAGATMPFTVDAGNVIDITLGGTTPDTSGKLRVFALLYTIDSVGGDKQADEVVRDQLA